MAETISENLQAHITNSGKSVEEISQAAGVPQATIVEFLNGGDIRVSVAGRIVGFLGLRLEIEVED